MRRSALAMVLTVLAALVASLGSPTAAAPPALQPAAIPQPDRDDGSLYVAPDAYFEGDSVKLTANLPNDVASTTVRFYMESSPGSGDYDQFEQDAANSYGNAVVSAYKVTKKAKIFALAPNGMATETQTLDPKVVEPGSCTVSGSTYVDPTFITPGQEVKLTANFPSEQAGTTVTFFTKDGDTATSIGNGKANTSGNAYLTAYEVEETQDVFAQTSKGVCSPTITLDVTTIDDPSTLPQAGTLKTDPASVRDGRTATIVANFPDGVFDVSAFQLKNGVWEYIGTDQSNSSGNAYITGHKFDGTETIVALTSDGRRTEIRDIETIPPNVVSGGPKTLGKNVVYVTTDSGATPTTKGVNYKGKAVLETNDVPTTTFDVDEFAVRGNSSAEKPKKPYKLKFEDKQKPFGMKSDKTWILLANYGDWTLVRSMVAWDLGKMLDGLKWTPSSTFAELFVNGKYVGSYQMVESIKIDKNRVNINAETGQVIEIDPHWKEDGVPGFVGKSGLNYAWKDPDEFKELDEEDCDQVANPSCEDPEGLTTAKIAAMKQKIKNFETVLYGADGTKDWSKISYSTLAPQDDWQTYLDLNSAVDYYLSREFTKDHDANFYRSNFFYTNNVDPDSVDPSDPNDPDKLFLGPIWDFDRSAGACTSCASSIASPTGWWMRGAGTSYQNTRTIHWYTRIVKDPRFLKALHDRWAAKKAAFAGVSAPGVSHAVTKLGGSDSYDLGKQVAANDRARWEGYGTRYHARTSTYAGELAWLRKWYADRYAWMDKELVKTPPPIPE